MKRATLTSIFLVIVFVSLAQNQDWHPIRTDDTYFYFGADEYRAYRIDSIVEYENKSTMFSFNELFAEYWDECFNPYGPPWIGKKIDVYKDSTIIYNKNDEPILICHNQTIGNQWILYFNANTHDIKAEVTNISFENIGFVWDSLVTITLSGAMEFPDNSIVISKHHGIVNGYNFLLFPNISTEFQSIEKYELCGQTSNENSLANLTAFDVYNFDIGDEFHTLNYKITWPYGIVTTNIKMMKKVIAKIYNQDSSQVTYTYNQCDKKGEKTIFETIRLDSSKINLLPYQSKIDFGEIIWDTKLEFNVLGNYMPNVRYKDFGGDFSYASDSCYGFNFIDKKKKDISKTMPYPWQIGIYYEGLGGPYSFHGLMFSESSYSLKYYKKGNTEWGTPFNCADLQVDIPDEFENPHIQVYPNPACEYITVDVNDNQENYSISFYNSLGQLLLQQKITNKTNNISLDGIQHGTIYYRLLKKHEIINSGSFIKE